ncbi:hypothetical protein BJ742DRAFT_775413 [Cladochytrium replicatum]|nr:hypothetical protein BJ742DRAFT_775413 [Cladochytrium replicatum]
MPLAIVGPVRIVFFQGLFPASRTKLQTLLTNKNIAHTIGVINNLTELSDFRPHVIIPTMYRVTEAVIEAAGPDLQLIQQFGVGLEGVDIPAAKKRGIAVANVRANPTFGNAPGVAENAVMHLLMLVRQYPQQRETFLSHTTWGFPCTPSLTGKTIVLLGPLGACGSATVKRLLPFGVRIIGVGRRSASECQDAWAELVGDPTYHVYVDGTRVKWAMEQAFACVVVATLDDGSRGFVGREEIFAMPRGGYLVNVSRGGVVDRDALLEALSTGHLAGAGLDVFHVEPIPRDDELLKYINVITTTPHTAGVTHESYVGLGQGVLDNIENLIHGRPLNDTA